MKVAWWTIRNSPAKRVAPGEEFTARSCWPTRLQQSSGAALDARAGCWNDGDSSVCIWRVFACAGKSSKPAKDGVIKFRSTLTWTKTWALPRYRYCGIRSRVSLKWSAFAIFPESKLGKIFRWLWARSLRYWKVFRKMSCPLRLRSSSSRLIGMVRSSKHLPTGSGKKRDLPLSSIPKNGSTG